MTPAEAFLLRILPAVGVIPAAGPKKPGCMIKTTFRILLLPALLATAGQGCVNEDRDHHDPVVKLAFEPVMHAQVRSEVFDDTPTSSGEDSFGVSVWSLDKEDSWATKARNAEPVLEMEQLVKAGNLWLPSPEIDWPSDQYNLSCIGFAPFTAATLCSVDEGVVFDRVDTSSDPGDLRYTLPQTDLSKTRNGGIVTLPMIPALCEVGFRVRGMSGYEATQVYLRRIELDGISLRGRFSSLPEPAWLLQENSREPIPFFDGDLAVEYNPQSAGAFRRIIPQQLEGVVRVEYEFETPTGERLQQSEEDIPLKCSLTAGRRYLFTLAVSPAGAEIIPENPTQLE